MEGEEKEERQEKMRTTRKRRLAVDKWDVYGSQMEQRAYKDLSSMNVAMTQLGVKLIEETNTWCEDRSGWVSDRVKGCIAQRRSANRNYIGERKEKEKRSKSGSWKGFTCTE